MRNTIWISAVALLVSGQLALAGASCVVVKKLGDSLAIEWVATADETVASATQKAKDKLLQQGLHRKYQDTHPQASTELPHAHVVIVKTDYQTVIGRSRTSYGCGFSAQSSAEAEQAALYDLRNYSWGWKPDYGYQVLHDFSY